MVSALGLENAAKRARAKLVESLPDKTRQEAKATTNRFVLNDGENDQDKKLMAMARADQSQTIVRLRFASKTEQVTHPISLERTAKTWRVYDGLTNTALSIGDWGRLNVSAMRIPRET